MSLYLHVGYNYYDVAKITFVKFIVTIMYADTDIYVHKKYFTKLYCNETCLSFLIKYGFKFILARFDLIDNRKIQLLIHMC